MSEAKKRKIHTPEFKAKVNPVQAFHNVQMPIMTKPVPAA